MSFANQALAAEYLFKPCPLSLRTRFMTCPPPLTTTWLVKLETLGIEIDTLTEEQIAYMNSWNF